MILSTTSTATGNLPMIVKGSDTENSCSMQLANIDTPSTSTVQNPDGTTTTTTTVTRSQHALLLVGFVARHPTSNEILARKMGRIDLDDTAAIAAAGIAQADVDALKRVALAAGAFVAAQNGFTVSQ